MQMYSNATVQYYVINNSGFWGYTDLIIFFHRYEGKAVFDYDICLMSQFNQYAMMSVCGGV